MKIYSISSAKETQNKLSAAITGLEESYHRQDQIVRACFNSGTKEEGYDIHNEPAIIRRHHNMKQLIHQIKPPCDKCPYKLGLVQTLTNPCPQCKENDYQTLERFQHRCQETTRPLEKNANRMILTRTPVAGVLVFTVSCLALAIYSISVSANDKMKENAEEKM